MLSTNSGRFTQFALSKKGFSVRGKNPRDVMRCCWWKFWPSTWHATKTCWFLNHHQYRYLFTIMNWHNSLFLKACFCDSFCPGLLEIQLLKPTVSWLALGDLVIFYIFSGKQTTSPSRNPNTRSCKPPVETSENPVVLKRLKNWSGWLCPSKRARFCDGDVEVFLGNSLFILIMARFPNHPPANHQVIFSC